jgi:hypothetical protein
MTSASGQQRRGIPPLGFAGIFACGFLAALWGNEMIVRLHDDQVQISAPKFHFLVGRPLERLKNGTPVPFDFQLQMWVDSRARTPRRALERFVVSYDLWEESFSVIQMRSPRKSASRLTSAAAEAWCLDRLSLPAGGLRPDQQVWLRLEVRSGDNQQQPVFGSGNITDNGISLNSLVEIFSRPLTLQQSSWTIETGPLRAGDLRKPRNGSE